MVKKIIFGFLFFVSFRLVNAQVPSEIEFGGMELKLSESVRKKLQADIDMITRSPKAFQTKVDRADLYFPIIEKIFKEENLPDDFKFLALQESSLISDAVSSSNAVGYWQFKKETAIEVGLRVDREIDERMNIVASSRGAAKYLKKNNTIYFNNWIYALLAYNTGAGGAKSHIKEKYIGANKMVIDGDMHWYVIRFLAHKLAYEGAVGKTYNHPMVLIAYDNCRKKSLHDVSKETQVSIEDLEMYNKWMLKGRVPDDKNYSVILPVKSTDKDKLLVLEPREIKEEEPKIHKEEKQVQLKIERKWKRRNSSDLSGTGDVAMLISLNGIRAIKAKAEDNSSRLALQGEISHEDFLRYNDMKSFEQIKPGEYYFLQRKKNKGLVPFHTVQYGETIRDISQKYGMRIESIRNKNRMGKNEKLQVGRVLWLRKKRSVSTPVEIKKVELPVVKPKKIVPDIQIVKDTQLTVLPIEIAESKIVITSDTMRDGFDYHIVKQGETLYGISKIYSLSLDSLRLWNNLISNDIKLGQSLVVKRNQDETSIEKKQTTEHIVLPGETLYQISRKYEVSIESIKVWNNKTDTNVSIGEKLVIKK